VFPAKFTPKEGSSRVPRPKGFEKFWIFFPYFQRTLIPNFPNPLTMETLFLDCLLGFEGFICTLCILFIKKKKK
jgi:hypothetical protein